MSSLNLKYRYLENFTTVSLARKMLVGCKLQFWGRLKNRLEFPSLLIGTSCQEGWRWNVCPPNKQVNCHFVHWIFGGSGGVGVACSLMDTAVPGSLPSVTNGFLLQFLCQSFLYSLLSYLTETFFSFPLFKNGLSLSWSQAMNVILLLWVSSGWRKKWVDLHSASLSHEFPQSSCSCLLPVSQFSFCYQNYILFRITALALVLHFKFILCATVILMLNDV